MKRLLPLILLFACAPAFAQKISALPSASALTGSELVPVVQAGATVATTTSAFGTYLTGVFGLAGWPSASGIPCYSGTLSWCTSYSAANPIPASLGGTGLTSITANDCIAGNSGGTALTYVVCGGVPGGSNTQIQFNNAGVFGGISTTGSGNVVLATSATLVTPALGTPSSATLTNATGLPISTGVSGLGTGVATFLGTPSSANLAAAVTGETGSGALVFGTSPTLTTPNLGTPSAVNLTNALSLPCAATPALTGDVTSSAGSCATTVSKVNGASVPASAALVGTNSSAQFTALTSIPLLPIQGYATASLPTCNSGTKGEIAYTTDGTAAFTFCNGTTWVSGGGTTFTMAGTGCTPTAATGDATGGSFTLASGPCTAVTITFNGAVGMTAGHLWDCGVADQTAQNAGTWIPRWSQSASTTTTATIPIPGAAGTTDVITFSCSPH